MKKLQATMFLMIAVLSASVSYAQEDKSKRASPPATFTTTVNGTNVTINYSQPSVKGRSIGKEIAPYGKVWRTGANEATTFEVKKDVTIEGKTLKAGRYALFTIPNEDEWVVIFNSAPDQWGAYSYDEKKDVLRVNVKPGKAKSFTEQLTFGQDGDKITLTWGDTQVAFAVK